MTECPCDVHGVSSLKEMPTGSERNSICDKPYEMLPTTSGKKGKFPPAVPCHRVEGNEELGRGKDAGMSHVMTWG